jgi:hypothetical protein
VNNPSKPQTLETLNPKTLNPKIQTPMALIGRDRYRRQRPCRVDLRGNRRRRSRRQTQAPSSSKTIGCSPKRIRPKIRPNLKIRRSRLIRQSHQSHPTQAPRDRSKVVESNQPSCIMQYQTTRELVNWCWLAGWFLIRSQVTGHSERGIIQVQ